MQMIPTASWTSRPYAGGAGVVAGMCIISWILPRIELRFLSPNSSIAAEGSEDQRNRSLRHPFDRFAPTASKPMSFVGRIIAGARELPFGGPLGALLERAARHVAGWHPPGDGDGRDGDPRRRIAFTIAVIALGAKMAKADGAVTRDEVAAFGEVFQIPPGEEDHVRLVFDLARKSTAGVQSYVPHAAAPFSPAPA